MADTQYLTLGVGSEITGIVSKVADVGRHFGRGEVASVVGEGADICRHFGRGEIASVVDEGADVGRHRRYGGFVGQVVVVAAESRRQFHIAATRQEYCVVADAQYLAFGVGGQVAGIVGEVADVCRHFGRGNIASIVGEVADVCRHSRDGRLVGQVVVVAAEPCWQFHIAAARQKYGVVADGQYLAFGVRGQVAGIVSKVADVCRHFGRGEVASVVGEGADVGGHRRDGGLVGQVVVILVPRRKERIALAYVYGARDAIGSMGMQGVRHTQQLLNGDEDVVVATDGVNLAFDKILSRRPINRAKTDATNLSGKQSVGVG